jgi:hypothetical protein
MQSPPVSGISTVVDVDLCERSYPIYIGPGISTVVDVEESRVTASAASSGVSGYFLRRDLQSRQHYVSHAAGRSANRLEPN